MINSILFFIFLIPISIACLSARDTAKVIKPTIAELSLFSLPYFFYRVLVHYRTLNLKISNIHLRFRQIAAIAKTIIP